MAIGSASELADLMQAVQQPDHQKCRQCGNFYPLTKAFFVKNATRENGYDNLCRPCKQERKRQRANAQVMQRVQQVEERGISLLADNSQELLERCPSAPVMFEEIMFMFGGSQGFARHLYGQYLTCEPGSAGRFKVLQLVATMGHKITEMGLGGQQVEKMTREELLLELKKLTPELIAAETKSHATESG